MKATLFASLASMVTLLLVSPVQAADESGQQQGASTNVIGTQEAPTVLNVVPWKDSQVTLDRKDPTSRLLDRALEPLDQEVLMREIEYHQLLTQEPGTDGPFPE